MKILVGEDLPPAVAGFLAAMEYDAQHVRDLGLAGETDQVVYARAQDLGAMLLTADLGFGNVHLYPPGTHNGVIILRFPDFFRRNDILDLVRRFIQDTDLESFAGALVVVTPSSYRVRR
jgi:predicted nuclease of predicted toxin-antitoxin system